MNEHEVCAYGVKYRGALVDVSLSQDEAAKTAKLIPGSHVIELYQEIKQEEESHD